MRENRAAGVLHALTVAALGLYAGAMLTEGFVLVPHWRSLPPQEFFTWYAANDARLFRFFGALTALMVLLAVANALVALAGRAPGRWLAVLAGAVAVVALLMFPVYFQGVNASFAAATLGPGEVGAELGRWATWHAARMVLSVVALAAVLCARGA